MAKFRVGCGQGRITFLSFESPNSLRLLKIPSSKPKLSNRSNFFAWFVVILGVACAAGIAFYGIFGSGLGRDTHREWLQLADKLKKQGEPVYFADVKPADVPPEQNFFAADVFDGLEAGAPSDQLLVHALEPGKGLAVTDLLAKATQGSGAASLDSLATAMQDAGLVAGGTDFLLAGDRVRAGMRSLGLDFSPLAVAADRPAARFPVDYAQPFPKLPHLRYLEALGDWLAIRSMAELSVGDSDAAFLDLMLIGRLADSVSTEPFVASQHTRRMLLGLFAGCIRVGIGWNAWNDEQLGRFESALERARLLTDFAWALRGERAQINTIIQLALSGQHPAASDALQSWLGKDLVRIDMRTLRARQVAINETIQQLLDALASGSGLQPAAFTVKENATALPPEAKQHFQELSDDARVFAQVQTYLMQAEAACALERYRLTHGSYPDKLEELAPDWIATLPADPVAGQPLGYQKTGSGYSLSGAGWTDGKPWVWTR